MADTSNCNMPLPKGAIVSLREVNEDTVWAICMLHVSKSQEKLVAPNAFSIAQAYFAKTAWFRAVYADETPVGFVMLNIDPEKASYFLWRFMIDEKYQGRGYGKKAMESIINYVRTLPNAKELTLTYHPGEGCPQPFYRKLGFEDTGKSFDDELEMKLIFQ